MKICRVGYNKFDFFMNINNKSILIAQTQTSLIGLDVFLIMCFPYDECSEIKISNGDLTESEIIEIVKKVIFKKMYKMQSDILKEMSTTEIDKNKYYNQYDSQRKFAKGVIWAEKEK